jgi:hypothetical protein
MGPFAQGHWSLAPYCFKFTDEARATLRQRQ